MLQLCDPAKRGMLPPGRWAGGLNFVLKDASGNRLDAVRIVRKAGWLRQPRGAPARGRTVDLVPPDQIDVPALSVLLPLGFALMLLSWAVLRRRDGLTAPRLATAWIAGWYVVAVIGATLLPMHLEWGDEPYRGYEVYRIILVPLITMRPSDFVLNIVMTLPLAALLYLVAGLRGKRRVVLTGFLLSLTIELTQGMLDLTLHGTRWADVNDLISNTLGAWLGYLWFWRAMGGDGFRRLAAACSLRRSAAPAPDAVR